jgi:hypothetical protein
MSIIQTTTGNSNFPDGSAKVFVFHTPTPGHVGKGKETNLYQSQVGERVGQSITVPAASRYVDEYGKWTTSSFQIPDGALLKIYGQRQGQWLTERLIAQTFIQARDGAAYRRITIDLIDWVHADVTQVTIEGRFDLVTLHEALGLGATVPDHFTRYFTERYVERMFAHSVIDAEIETRQVIAAEKVTNTQGKEVTVQAPQRGRAMDL